MEAAAARIAAAARLEPIVAASIACVASAAVVAFAPPGGDSAAHLYRTELLRDGVALWDNLWFAGQYPLASYSLLYYFGAAVVGNVPLVVAAAVASAWLFASLATDVWGSAARWPARIFGVLAAGPLFTGTYSYALGLAAVLAALRLLQLDRRKAAVGASALALAFSPLAFAYLCLSLGAIVVGRRPARVGPTAAALATLGAAQVAVIVLFRTDGRYPFSTLSLAAVVGVASLGAALALRGDTSRVLAPFFALWAGACLVAFVVPSPFGDNLARLRALVIPLVLLAAVLARFRPWPLAYGALAAALVFNLGPDISALPKRIDDRPTSTAAFWAPAVDFLRGTSADYRVEVVPTFGHWEAYFIPRAGLPLARGWYRQIDLAENPVLYEDPLTPTRYRAWLRELGVRFVVLPHARLGALGAEREGDLLRSGRAGLRLALRAPTLAIYELPGATPILTGPGAAHIDRVDHELVAGRVGAPGAYLLRVRYTPHRSVRGPVCLSEAPGGMTRLVAHAAGAFSVEPALRAPTARGC
jgi:hypothetical protein